MKTLKVNAALALSLVIFIIASCKKYEEPRVFDPQNVTGNFLDSLANPLQTSSTVADFSVGFQFIPQVNGKITRLSIDLPSAGDYKVSIWDVDNKTLITQKTLSKAAGHRGWKDIPELSVEAQKTYAISFLMPPTEYYYVDNLKLPVELENITILNSVTAHGDGYPVDQVINDHLFGFVDFTFQADPQ